MGLHCLTLFLTVGFDQALAQTLDLPDNPDEQAVIQPGFVAPAAGLIVAAPNPDYAARPPVELEVGDKANFYLHRVESFGTVLGPAVEAATVMASPPKAYPNNWRQGADAYARNYGAVLGRVQTAEFSRFVVGAALREDPRYYPSPNRAIAARIAHAIWFTLVDRSDSGHSRLAFANLVGATAGGFVGDAYLPVGYTDLRHAAERTGVQMSTFAAGNVFDEFAPEWNKLARALNSRFRRKN